VLKTRESRPTRGQNPRGEDKKKKVIGQEGKELEKFCPKRIKNHIIFKGELAKGGVHPK